MPFTGWFMVLYTGAISRSECVIFSKPFCFHEFNFYDIDFSSSNKFPPYDFKNWIFKCMTNDWNNPITLFYEYKVSIFFFSRPIGDNHHMFFFFFCLQVTYLPKQQQTELWHLRSALNQTLDFSCCHLPMVRRTRFGTFPIEILNELRAVPLVTLQRRCFWSPSRGALRGRHHREHVLEVVHPCSELSVSLDFIKWATKTSSSMPSQVGDPSSTSSWICVFVLVTLRF